MRTHTALLWCLATASALVPALLTWLVLCSSSHPKGVCFEKLMSLSLSISKDARHPRTVLPPLLHSRVSTTMPVAEATVLHNISFSLDATTATGDVLISVMSDWKTFTGPLGRASRTGWAAYLVNHKRAHKYHVIFFAGECPGLRTNVMYKADGQHFYCLDTTDDYPPQRKVFATWKYVSMYQLNNFKWFAKVDQDTYVNARNIDPLFKALHPYDDTVQYIGKAFFGRQSEAKKLGLNGKSYCSGMAYMVSRKTLNAVGPHVSRCLQGVVSNHSDTEFGRCVHAYAGVDCRPIAPEYKIRNMYFAREGASVWPLAMERGRLHVHMSSTPLLPNFKAVFLHPIKSAEEMDHFHNQVVKQLRPLQVFPDNPHPARLDWHYQLAQQDFRQSCVHNPTLQRIRNAVELPVCHPPEREVHGVEQIVNYGYVLAGRGHTEDASSEIFSNTLRDTLRYLYIQATVMKYEEIEDPLFSSASRDVARKTAIAEAITAAQSAGHTTILLISELAFLRCDFRTKFKDIAGQDNCGNHLFTEDSGGVLILGAGDDAAAACKTTIERASCCDLRTENIKPVGVVFHRSTYEAILRWLADAHNAEHTFDAIYSHLAELGYIIRVAGQPLVALSTGLPSDTGSEFCGTHDQMMEYYAKNGA